VLEAMWRGIMGRCPQCGRTSIFGTFLKPVERCIACGEDWQARSADDFPPYIVILLLGHIIAPGMIGLEVLAPSPLAGPSGIVVAVCCRFGSHAHSTGQGRRDGAAMVGATEDEDSRATAPLAGLAPAKDTC
jgi:hypothetical protein